MAAEDTAVQVINNSMRLIGELADASTRAANSALTAVQGSFVPNYEPATIKGAPPKPSFSSGPREEGIGLPKPPTVPSTPQLNTEGLISDLREIGDLRVKDPPSFSASKYKYKKPGGEPAHVAAFTKAPPSIDTTVDPVDIPDVGILKPLTLVELKTTFREPNVSLPRFNATRPDAPGKLTGLDERLAAERAANKTQVDAFMDRCFVRYMQEHFPAYQTHSALVDEHLSNVMTGDATAWHDTTQQKVFDIGRAQVNAEQARLRVEQTERLVQNGAVLDWSNALALERSQEHAFAATTAAAYQTVEKRADRELQHLQFTVTQLQAQRQFALTTWIQFAGQHLAQWQLAISMANDTIDVLFKQYQTCIELFNAEVELYQVAAKVYETEIEAALVEYRLLEAELKAEELKATLNQAKIAELNAQVELEKLRIEAAATKIDAQAQQISLRKVPLEIYELEIRAYAAYVQGRRAEIDVYQANMAGERLRAEGYQQETDHYRAQLDAWRARLDGLIARQEAERTVNRDILDLQELQLRNEDIKLRREQWEDTGKRRETELELQTRRDELARDQTIYQAQLEAYTAQTQHIRAVNADRAAILIEQLKGFYQHLRSQGEVMVGAAGVLGDMGAGIATSTGGIAATIAETITNN